jgi:cytochrome c oxidase subunit 3
MVGMRWFIASLAMLFGTTLVACLMVTLETQSWRADAVPELTRKLWISTLFLLAVSVVLERGLHRIRRNRTRELFWMLLVTVSLALGFLVNQTRVWMSLGNSNIQLPTNARTLFTFSVALITGLHALHVLGGFVPLAVCSVRAARERYSSFDHAGVTYCAMYWHFLDATWVVIVSVLLLL